MMTPRESTASGLLRPEGADGAEVTRTSLMSVIHGLYDDPAEGDEAEGKGEETQGEEAQGGGDGGEEGEGGEVDVRSSMVEIDALLQEQERRRNELGAYITHLQV